MIAAGHGDTLAEALWRAHLGRRLADIGRLRVSWPRSSLPKRDPRALRVLSSEYTKYLASTVLTHVFTA